MLRAILSRACPFPGTSGPLSVSYNDGPGQPSRLRVASVSSYHSEHAQGVVQTGWPGRASFIKCHLGRDLEEVRRLLLRILEE